ncbi:MICOS complex subunit MIC10 [Coelomomyces lativittatus]|nr:MICOS complex subunit MIC10 [Coelomomyces lativittatus]
MMSSSMDLDTTIPSEEILARKWDRCISNLVIKVATSTSVGILSSVTLFQKKTWPVALAAGFGLGLAYEQCQKSFETPILRSSQVSNGPNQETSL